MGKKKLHPVGHGSNKSPGLLKQPGRLQPEALRQQPQPVGKGGGGGGGGVASQILNPSNQAGPLRAQHLLRVATWASSAVPPLGALLGYRLGVVCESTSIPAPPSPHVICERCESIMQVGVNCSIRIIKEKKKRKSQGSGTVTNRVTYICHCCKHGNASSGTPKNHVKTKISQAAARSNLNMLGQSSANVGGNTQLIKGPLVDGRIQQEKMTASSISPIKLVPPVETGNSKTKKKRKGWSTLKELASSQGERSDINCLSASFLSPLGKGNSLLSMGKPGASGTRL